MVILCVVVVGYFDQLLCLLVIDGVGVIEGCVFGILCVVGQVDVVLLIELWMFGSQVDYVVWYVLFVECGGGVVDYIYVFDKLWVDL